MIEVNQLTKRYGDLTAVAELSFTLVPGEILGLLGPNGAGKSTAMRMLTGFLRPTAGTAKIWGCDMWADSLTAQAHIGYLPEGAPAYEEMTPLGFLKFIGEARDLKGDKLNSAIEKSIDTMSLNSVLHQRIETLAKGFKRRVGLAQAIIHDPDVLILDEPTDGLDPNQKHQVREMIKGLSKNKIVIISTHILEEVTAVCNRVMVMSLGRIVFDASPGELMQRSEFHGAVTLKLSSEVAIGEIANALGKLQGVQRVLVEGESITVFPLELDGELFGHVASLAQSSSWPLDSIYLEPGRLDEVFRKLTEGGPQ